MNKLPNGWTQSTFEECLQYEQPTKYIVKSTKYNDNYKMPVLTAGKSFILGYTNETDGIFTQTPVIIFDDFTTDTKFVDFHFKVKSSAMKILRPNGKADIKFLYYLMQIIYHRSDTHKRYWISEYSKIKIPLPPIEIQKQIAERLDFLFDKIDKALQLLNENKEYIKKYRLSILKDAFEGKLTRPSKNWEIKTLGEVCEKISAGGDRPDDCTSEKTEENKIPIFSNGVENNGLYGYTKTPTITKPALTVSARGTIGFVCVRYEPFFPIVRLICAIPNDRILSLEFLFYTLKYLIPQGEGSTIPQLTIPNFKQIKIPLPPLETQKEIVSILDEKFKAMEEIERLNNENIENLLLLKKSLLKDAFGGKLEY